MTVADRCREEGLVYYSIPVAPCVRWHVLALDPCLVGGRASYLSARVFRYREDVAAQLGIGRGLRSW